MKIRSFTARGSLVRGASASFAIRLIDMALAYGLTIVLARFMGVEKFGEYTFVLSIVTILTIPARFGLPALIVRETGAALAHDDLDRIYDLKSWAYRRALTISLPILVLGTIFIIAFPTLMDSEERVALGIGLLLVTLFPVAAIRAAILRGMDLIVSSQLTQQIVRPAVQLALMGGLWLTALAGSAVLSPSSSVAMATNVVGAAFSWLAGAILLKRYLGKGTRPARKEFDIAGWRSSLTALGLANAMYIIDAQVGIMLLGMLSDDSQVSLYKIASQGAMVVAMGYSATNVPIGPRIAKTWAAGEHDKVRRLVARGAQLSVVFALPVAVVFLIGGRWLLATILGSEFASAFVPLLILTGAQMINSAFGSASSLLNMTHHERSNLIAFAVAMVMNGLLGVTLIPRYGAMGGAAASAVSIVVRNLILWFCALRFLGVNTAFWARRPQSSKPGMEQ